MKNFLKNLFMFIEGGLLYSFIEVCYKSAFCHKDQISWTIAVLGGVCFLIMGLINKWFTFEIPLFIQWIIASFICTMLEFVAGLILNVWLNLGIWSYSNLPGNILGQICPQFFAIWFGISIFGIFLDDIIRWKFFQENKPHYHLFKWGKKNDEQKFFMI